MAISNAMCTSFKQEVLQGLHNFTNTTGNAFKIALVKSGGGARTYGAATTNLTDLTTATTDETSGTGYTTGGNTLTNVTPTTSGTTAFTDFADTSWTSSSFTASGALIYNSTNGNRAVSTHTFSGDQTVASGTFTVVFPTPDSTNAIIRIA